MSDIATTVLALYRIHHWRCTPLEGKAGCLATPISEAGHIRSANTAALHLLVEYESQDQLYWHSKRVMKEKAKRGHLFATLQLLLEKSPFHFAVLIRNRYMFNTRQQRFTVK
jgi:hypothetical protein